MEVSGTKNYYGEIQIDLPNATTVLVLGILSIVSCICYGFFGMILAIIALIIANKDKQRYLLDPDSYSLSSYRNLISGRIVAIIGLSLSGLFFLIILIVLFFNIVNEIPWKGLT